jgi:hypothetical protein
LKRQGNKGNLKGEEASYCAEETVVGVVNARKKMALAGGSHLSTGEGRKMGTGLGKVSWAAGSIWSWARLFPPGPFHVFLFFASFLFLFFLFLS